MKNEITLLINGKDAFKSIIEKIKNARLSIEINMFIWRDDNIGNLIARELINAADRGVEISISKDKLGSLFELSEENMLSFFNSKNNFKYHFQAFFLHQFYRGNGKKIKRTSNKLLEEMLSHANIKVSYDIEKGDHSKYYIFDNEILIMGGINIEDKEINQDITGRKYHDFMVEFTGEKYVMQFLNRLNSKLEYDPKSNVEFIFNIVNEKHRILDVKHKILDLLDDASSSVEIIMAYLGDRDIEDRLVKLVNKGINLILIIPGKANLQHDLNMQIIKRMYLKTSGKIRIYLSPNMIHAKLMRIDNTTITIGSTNFNRNAMSKLSELNTVIRNNVVNNHLTDSINDQISISTLINDVKQIKYSKFRVFMEKQF